MNPLDKVLGLLMVALVTLPGGASAQQRAASPLDGLPAMIEVARAAREANPGNPGTGPYPAMMVSDFALPTHTLYYPRDLDRMGGKKLGLLLWGNGGCSNDGASAQLHLSQVASSGYLVIAPGKILSGPRAVPGGPTAAPMMTTVQDVRAALDWALAENDRPGSIFYHRIDPNSVAVAGHSCGAMQAIVVADDPRIKAVIVHNSGIFGDIPDRPPLLIDKRRLQGLHTPVLYLMGGKSDVAWTIAQDDFQRIDKVPVLLASIDVGHGGTFARPNGGEAAKVAVDWLEWQLRKDRTAARTFVGPNCSLCIQPEWTVQKKNLR